MISHDSEKPSSANTRKNSQTTRKMRTYERRGNRNPSEGEHLTRLLVSFEQTRNLNWRKTNTASTQVFKSSLSRIPPRQAIRPRINRKDEWRVPISQNCEYRRSETVRSIRNIYDSTVFLVCNDVHNPSYFLFDPTQNIEFLQHVCACLNFACSGSNMVRDSNDLETKTIKKG